MTIEKLFDLCEASPSRELKLFLSDGRQFSVKHPNYVALDDGTETITVFDEVSRFAEVIDVLAVVSVRHEAALG